MAITWFFQAYLGDEAKPLAYFDPHNLCRSNKCQMMPLPLTKIEFFAITCPLNRTTWQLHVFPGIFRR
jgi:hypothetical protein